MKAGFTGTQRVFFAELACHLPILVGIDQLFAPFTDQSVQVNKGKIPCAI